MLAELLELAPAGFEQVDGDGFVEFALYGAPGELPVALRPVPPSSPASRSRSRATRSATTGPTAGGSFTNRPGLVDIHVRAPWHEPPATGIDIVIDPGQAFGTGAHPTTRLCLELLQELPPGGPLADLGCGSGVLAIAAAKLGFAPITAVDNEAAAVEATLANATCQRCDARSGRALDLRT